MADDPDTMRDDNQDNRQDNMQVLAEAFAARHAEAAADVLDGLAPDHVGAFIAALPAEAAGPLLVHLRAQQTANCLRHVPAANAAAAIAGLTPQPAADVLRRLEAGPRGQILAAIPRARRVQIELIMRQPRQTVGAWMDTRIATARTASTAGEAVRRLALHDDSANGWLFVVGARRELAGAIRLGTLMNAAAQTRLDALLGQGPPPLRANVAVSAALDHAGWREHDVLPVIDAKDRLVGVLTHVNLRRALGEAARAQVKDEARGTMMDVANIWYLGMAEIMNATIARKPTPNKTDRPGGAP